MKNRKVVIWGIAAVIVITFIIAVLIDNSRKVDFEDETMGEMIAKTMRLESVDKLRVDDLEKITVLNIGYTGYYNTLLDMEKCPNLQRLFINCPEDVMSYYPFVGREIPEPESEERVEQIEKELGDVLGQCSKLEDIYISRLRCQKPVYLY